jgi:8-oxo-dGTP diphosphatase
MNNTILGLREGALTLAYNAILVARGGLRRLTRPSQVGVRILVPRADTVLLVRHRGGRRPWSLPGGGVNRGESLADAACREVHEEAGCEVAPDHLLGVYHAFYEGMSNYTIVFVCTPLGPAAAPEGDLEIVDARFFPVDDLPANTERGSLERIAEHARGERGLIAPWFESDDEG